MLFFFRQNELPKNSFSFRVKFFVPTRKRFLVYHPFFSRFNSIKNGQRTDSEQLDACICDQSTKRFKMRLFDKPLFQFNKKFSLFHDLPRHSMKCLKYTVRAFYEIPGLHDLPLT